MAVALVHLTAGTAWLAMPCCQDIVQGACPWGAFRHDKLQGGAGSRGRLAALSWLSTASSVLLSPAPLHQGWFGGSLGAHLADGVEGPDVLQPTVGQPVGDLSALQQPLAASEVTMLTQHPAAEMGRVRSASVGKQTPAGMGRAGLGSLTCRL